MDFAKLLSEKNLRPTPHRVRVAQKVLAKHCHFTADEISEWASGLKRPLSRATVYNILNEFVAVGLLRTAHSANSEKTVYDSNTSTHYHFCDSVTGKIYDLEPDKVKLNFNSLEGYRIEDVSVVLTGRKI